MSEFLESLPWQIIVGVLVSAVLSFGGFVIGVRAGKDNSDRSALRDQYKLIFAHFRELAEAIDSGVPKQWSDFTRTPNGYAPLIRAMARDGSIHALPQSLAGELEEAEKTILHAAWEWNKFVEDTLIDRAKAVFAKHVKNPNLTVSGTSYRPLQITKIAQMDDAEIEDFLRHYSDEKELSFRLEIALERGKTTTLRAHPHEMNDSDIPSLVSELHSAIANSNDSKERTSKLLESQKLVVALKEKIATRINEPHPFWQTVKQAFRDPFRS